MFTLEMKPVRLREGNDLPLVTWLRNERAGIQTPQSDRLLIITMHCFPRIAILCIQDSDGIVSGEKNFLYLM